MNRAATPYAPLPGTVPHKAIQHLKTLAAGAELSTNALCEAIGQTVTNGMTTQMHRALQSGLVKTRKAADSRLLFWSLGDGTPLPAQQRPEGEEDDDAPLPTRPSAWTGVAPACARSVFDLAATVSASSEDGKPEAEPAPAPAAAPANALGWAPAPPAPAAAPRPAPAPAEQLAAYFAALDLEPVAEPDAGDDEAADAFVCAVWSDGRLQLQRGDTELALLSVDETRALLRYLDRIAETA